MSHGRKRPFDGGSKQKREHNASVVPNVDARFIKSSAVRALAQRVRWQDIALVERKVVDRVLKQRGWNEALIVSFWKDVAKEMRT